MNIFIRITNRIKKQSMGTYPLYLGIFLVFPIFIISTFTILIDPYYVFNSRRIEKINKWKVASQKTTRSSKPLRFILLKPKNIVIGSSTAEVGIDPSYKNWMDGKGYNFSFGGGHLSEANSVFKFAIKYGIDEAILVTDFVRFFPNQDQNKLNISTMKNNPFRQFGNSQLLLNWFNVILSPNAIRDSFITLISQNKDPDLAKSNHFIQSNGSRVAFYQLSSIFRNGGYEYAFKSGLKNRLEVYKENICYKDSSYKKKLPGISYYSKILELAHKNNIKLRIIIPPIHATGHIALIRSDQYNLYQKWKELLLDENMQIAAKLNNSSFSIYDFGLINKYSMEEIPPNSKSQKMIWFGDAYHFTKVYGDKIMDFIFGENEKFDKNFGYELNENLIRFYSKANLKKLQTLNKQNKFSFIFDEITIFKKESCPN